MKTDELTTLFIQVVNTYIATEKKPHYYGSILLYRSEVHMIAAIGSTPVATVTSLSGRLAITKSAVSQTVSKLVAKQLVLRNSSGSADSEIPLVLSDTGRNVYAAYQDHHREVFGFIEEKLSGLTPHDAVVVSELLNSLRDMIID